MELNDNDDLYSTSAQFAYDLMTRSSLECFGGYPGPRIKIKEFTVIVGPYNGDSHGVMSFFKNDDLVKFYSECRKEIFNGVVKGCEDIDKNVLRESISSKDYLYEIIDAYDIDAYSDEVHELAISEEELA